MSHPITFRPQVPEIDWGWRGLERNPFGHLDALLLERATFRRVVGQQPDSLDAQVTQDRGRRAVIAGIDRKAQCGIGVYRVQSSVLQGVGSDLVRQTDSPSLLMEVYQQAAASSGQPA